MNHEDAILIGMLLILVFILVFKTGKSFADKLQEATVQPIQEQGMVQGQVNQSAYGKDGKLKEGIFLDQGQVNQSAYGKDGKLQEATVYQVPMVSAPSYTPLCSKRPTGTILTDMDPFDKTILAGTTVDQCINVCNKYKNCQAFYYINEKCVPYSSITGAVDAPAGAITFSKKK